QQQVDQEIDRMAAKFGLSRDLFLRTIRDDRQMPIHEYRQEIWGRLALKQLAVKQIQVTEEDLDRAFETEYGPRVRIRMIVSLTRERAEQLRTLALQNPDRFGDLAKEHSEDNNSASVRGQIPPIRKHVEDPALEKAAFGLAEGQVSGVIAMAGRFIVIKCEKRLQPVYVAKQFQTDARRRLADRVRFQKMRSAAASVFQQLQQTAKITNVYNTPQLSQQMPGVVALVNGRKITERMLAEQCISSYGNLVLDVEINRILLAQALKQRKLQVLRQDLDEEIAQAADSYGFIKPDGSPDVAAWFKKVTEETNVSVDLYVRDAIWPAVALKKLVGSAIQVSEEDMRKGFESHYGPRVEVLAIVLNNHRQATTVWELAKNNPTEYYFGQLAEQYSVEPVSRSNAGQVPPIRRHGGRPHIEEEVFRLKPGELSGIVAIGDKYLIMHCLGLTDPVVAELAAVHEELYKNLHENKLRIAMNREFDRLKTRAEVVNFLQPGSSTAAIQPTRPSGNPLQR
ncbi:MAG: peptidylprolyl isomerase, partial [Pirellulaceae bacterium]